MRCAVGFALLSLSVMSFLSAQRPTVTLNITDLSPKFLAFYDAVSRPGVNEAQRWSLWKKMYDFAAVPPTPEGDALARTMLDEAWPKFGAALPLIKQGANVIRPQPKSALEAVAELLASDVPIHAEVIAFVGDFEGNAYTYPSPKGPTVAVEIEDPDAGLKLTHEFTHVVEAEQANLSLGWKRTLAHTIFTEGLAVRVVHRLHPELSDAKCVGEMTPNWFARATDKRAQILADVLPHLAADDSNTVMLYTMGRGHVGLEREAYYAGWLVIGDLLAHGWTFPRLARIPDAQMLSLVRESLTRLRKKTQR